MLGIFYSWNNRKQEFIILFIIKNILKFEITKITGMNAITNGVLKTLSTQQVSTINSFCMTFRFISYSLKRLLTVPEMEIWVVQEATLVPP